MFWYTIKNISPIFVFHKIHNSVENMNYEAFSSYIDAYLDRGGRTSSCFKYVSKSTVDYRLFYVFFYIYLFSKCVDKKNVSKFNSNVSHFKNKESILKHSYLLDRYKDLIRSLFPLLDRSLAENLLGKIDPYTKLDLSVYYKREDAASSSFLVNRPLSKKDLLSVRKSTVNTSREYRTWAPTKTVIDYKVIGGVVGSKKLSDFVYSNTYLSSLKNIYGEELINLFSAVIISICIKDSTFNTIWNNYQKLSPINELNTALLKDRLIALHNFLSDLGHLGILSKDLFQGFGDHAVYIYKANLSKPPLEKFWTEATDAFGDITNFNVIVDTSPNNLSDFALFRKSRSVFEKELNKTKVFVNIKYLLFLLEHLFSSEDNYLSTIGLSGLRRKVKKGVLLSEYWIIRKYLSWLVVIIPTSLSGRIELSLYFKYKADLRGRFYHIASPFSLIGRKFLQPLFEVDLSRLSPEEREINYSIAKEHSLSIINRFFSSSFTSFEDALKHLCSFSIEQLFSLGVNDLFWYVIYMYVNERPVNHIRLDCKCSAFQHNASIFKLEKILPMVGLSKKQSSTDIYLYILDKSLQLLMVVDPVLHTLLLQYDLNVRNLLKHCVMTSIYGASSLTMAEQIFDCIKDVLFSLGVSVDRARKIFPIKSLIPLVSCLKKAMADRGFNVSLTIKHFGRLFVKSKNKTILVGDFLLKNKYHKKVPMEFTFRSGGLKHKIKGKFIINVVDNIKTSKTAFVNFIHCCDACFLFRLMKKHIIFFSIFPIHDCVIVAHINAEVVIASGMDVIKEMYHRDFLLNALKAIDLDFKDPEVLESIEYLLEKAAGSGVVDPQEDFITESLVKFPIPKR